jgi:hypothetical protein
MHTSFYLQIDLVINFKLDKMTSKMGSLPTGALSSHTVLAGTPVRSRSHSRGKQIGPNKTRAIAAPEKWDILDREEEDRLQHTDAFKELVALSKKQSVNRPQKVRYISEF